MLYLGTVPTKYVPEKAAFSSAFFERVWAYIYKQQIHIHWQFTFLFSIELA